MTVSPHQELGRRICEAALLRGQFTLRSGKTSTYYLDKYLFETNPDLLHDIVRLISKLLPSGVAYDRLAGPELGAVAIVTGLSLEVGKPFVIVRKEEKGYGTAKKIEGKLEKGERVVLVEDVVTSGGQALEAALYLRQNGFEVVKVLVVLDREQGGMEKIRQEGFLASALFRFSEWGIKDQ